MLTIAAMMIAVFLFSWFLLRFFDRKNIIGLRESYSLLKSYCSLIINTIRQNPLYRYSTIIMISAFFVSLIFGFPHDLWLPRNLNELLLCVLTFPSIFWIGIILQLVSGRIKIRTPAGYHINPLFAVFGLLGTLFVYFPVILTIRYLYLIRTIVFPFIKWAN